MCAITSNVWFCTEWHCGKPSTGHSHAHPCSRHRSNSTNNNSLPLNRNPGFKPQFPKPLGRDGEREVCELRESWPYPALCFAGPLDLSTQRHRCFLSWVSKARGAKAVDNTPGERAWPLDLWSGRMRLIGFFCWIFWGFWWRLKVDSSGFTNGGWECWKKSAFCMIVICNKWLVAYGAALFQVTCITKYICF